MVREKSRILFQEKKYFNNLDKYYYIAEGFF